MFTGIIEATGQIQQLKASAGGGLQLWIRSSSLDFSDVKLGDSIATNGVCLTVTALGDQAFAADVSAETVAHTRLGQYRLGQTVNLEKALLASSRLGGHMVSGHVDGVAEIKQIQTTGNSTQIWVEAPKSLQRYIAHKGSVTIDGISLTVNELAGSQFRLTIVPHTGAQTTLSTLKVGAMVHIEVDLIARYLERLLLSQSTVPEKSAGVGLDLLAKSGFL